MAGGRALFFCMAVFLEAGVSWSNMNGGQTLVTPSEDDGVCVCRAGYVFDGLKEKEISLGLM